MQSTLGLNSPLMWLKHYFRNFYFSTLHSFCKNFKIKHQHLPRFCVGNFATTKVLTWIPWNLSFRYIHCAGQFTPKMKANAEPRLLSCLVWIDSGVVVSQPRLESFFREVRCNGMTSFMEFMRTLNNNIQEVIYMTSSRTTKCFQGPYQNQTKNVNRIKLVAFCFA